MQFSPDNFPDKYTVEWFVLEAISRNNALQSESADELYWKGQLKKYPQHEQNILEAKELVNLLYNVLKKGSTVHKQKLIWKKIVRKIKDQ